MILAASTANRVLEFELPATGTLFGGNPSSVIVAAAAQRGSTAGQQDNLGSLDIWMEAVVQRAVTEPEEIGIDLRLEASSLSGTVSLSLAGYQCDPEVIVDVVVQAAI